MREEASDQVAIAVMQRHPAVVFLPFANLFLATYTAKIVWKTVKQTEKVAGLFGACIRYCALTTCFINFFNCGLNPA